MKKNPHFLKVWKWLETQKIDKSLSNFLIAKSNDSQDVLTYNPRLNVIYFHLIRQPYTRIEMFVHPEHPAPFDLIWHEYNNKPPYLEINVGKYTSILHF